MESPLLLRKQLIEAALALYLEEGVVPSAAAVAEAAGVERATFYAEFDGSWFVLPAFYELCIDQYREVRGAIDGYDTFGFDEQLATFIFLMFDFLEEQLPFARRTFEPYVIEDRAPTGFREGVGRVFHELLQSAAVPPTNQLLVDRERIRTGLTWVYLGLVRFWLEDTSPQREQTVALVDKVVAFVAELATFGGIERGVDLAKYMVNIGLLPVDKWPFFRDWFAEGEAEADDGRV